MPATVRPGVVAVRPEQQEFVLCVAGVGLRRFTFDAVFNDRSEQQALYHETGAPVVSEFLNGVNGCIMVYGQTGSGKTFSMFGPNDAAATSLSPLLDQAGIAPRALSEVMVAVARRRQHGLQIKLRLSCVEIFGKDILDLLHGGAALGAWHGVAARALADDSAAVEIDTVPQMESLLRMAETAKRRAATAMNERSSRAHTLMMLSLRQTCPQRDVTMHSILCLADLGGSEQLGKSQVQGDRLVEAVNINLGLLALKNVMTALRRRKAYVPFYSSIVTSALRPVLEGNSRVAVVVTGSMESRQTRETMEAMRFGQTVSSIKYDITVNLNTAEEAMVALNKEIAELEARIQVEERWENRVVKRRDVDGEETVVTSVPIGAEELRSRYEELLQLRRELVGQ